MTVTAETPTTAADAPEVAAVAGVLRQLWPSMGEHRALQHARTFVRINERHYGPVDQAALTRLSALTPVVSPDLVPDDALIPLPHGDLFLRKWTPDMDRRPRNKTPRWADPEWQQHVASGGRVGSAKHGECTNCAKEGVLKQAVYRLSDDRDTYSRSSLCAQHARKLIGGPVVVPRFSSSEEAQAWLDANGD